MRQNGGEDAGADRVPHKSSIRAGLMHPDRRQGRRARVLYIPGYVPDTFFGAPRLVIRLTRMMV